MHAGTPTAVSAHVFLCVALACVMSARAFTDALRPPSAPRRVNARARGIAALGVLITFTTTYLELRANDTARALVTAPGTSAHVWRVFVPQQTAFALAARARGSMDAMGAWALAGALATAALAATTPGWGRARVATLGFGYVATKIGSCDGLAFVLCATWYAASRMCAGSGGETYFAHWAGTIACEALALCAVEFPGAFEGRDAVKRARARRAMVSRVRAGKSKGE
jgi:hypothetical protein